MSRLLEKGRGDIQKSIQVPWSFSGNLCWAESRNVPSYMPTTSSLGTACDDDIARAGRAPEKDRQLHTRCFSSSHKMLRHTMILLRVTTYMILLLNECVVASLALTCQMSRIMRRHLSRRVTCSRRHTHARTVRAYSSNPKERIDGIFSTVLVQPYEILESSWMAFVVEWRLFSVWHFIRQA